MKRIEEQSYYTLYLIIQLFLGIQSTKFHFDWLLRLGTSIRNVRWPKKSLIGIKNPYSDRASFFLVETSISTMSRLQIYRLSLFYPNAENGEIRDSTICLEKHQLMFCSLENRYSHTYLRSFHYI